MPAKTTKPEVKKIKRIPLHKQKNLALKGDPNFHYFIALDKNDRIQRLLNAGYVFADASELEVNGRSSQNPSVEGKEAARVSLGNSGHGYLLKIPMKYWLEDQEAERQERVLGNLPSG